MEMMMGMELRQVDDVRLEDFCPRFDPRAMLLEPFNQEGLRCATDGRLLGVVDTDEPDTPAPEGDSNLNRNYIPRVAGLLRGAWRDDAAWTALTAAISEERIPCKDCEGEGLLYRIRCWRCRGTGESACSQCGQDTECEDCEGTGSQMVSKSRSEHEQAARNAAGETTEPCETCEGTGSTDVRVLGLLVAKEKLRKIYTATTEVAPAVVSGSDALQWRLGAMRGLLMAKKQLG